MVIGMAAAGAMGTIIDEIMTPTMAVAIITITITITIITPTIRSHRLVILEEPASGRQMGTLLSRLWRWVIK
jgi:hypothetical protein